jgi:hypothetical protein
VDVINADIDIAILAIASSNGLCDGSCTSSHGSAADVDDQRGGNVTPEDRSDVDNQLKLTSA